MNQSQQVKAAIAEFELMSTIVNSVVDNCHLKCIPTTYLEGELNKGESICIDRCVAKYVAATQKIAAKLQGQTK